MAYKTGIGVRGTAAIAAAVTFAAALALGRCENIHAFTSSLYGPSAGLFGTLSGFAITAQSILIGWSSQGESKKASRAWDDISRFLHGTFLVSVGACCVSLLAVGASSLYPSYSSGLYWAAKSLFPLWAAVSAASLVLASRVSRILHHIATSVAPERKSNHVARPDESEFHSATGQSEES